MIFLEIFRFEISCQSRRGSTWAYFAILLTVTFFLSGELASDYASMDGSFVNGPFLIAAMSVLFSSIGLLTATALAGDAAARDAQTRMAPLVYTTPVAKSAYFWGRFCAAFALYALIIAAVPLGLLLIAAVSNPDSDLTGPFRPAAYAGAYLFFLLPNAFVTTALMFSLAALSRRAVLAYLGGLFLLGVCAFNWAFVAMKSGHWEMAKVLDPFGAIVLDELSKVWTPADRNTRLIPLTGSLISNRTVWICIAFGVLALAQRRFRLAHATTEDRRAEWADSPTIEPAAAPGVGRTFGFSTRTHQVWTIARESFRSIAWGWGGIVLAAAAAFLVFSGLPIAHMGVPLLPTTQRITAFLAAPLTNPQEINFLIVPLLIVFYSGELVWREREARLNDIADTLPATDWTLFLGKFGGLSLALLALQALVMAAAIVTQRLLDHHDFQIGLYIRTLFGLQLADYLLFAVLALVIHAVANHKYVAHLAAAIAYASIAFAPALRVDHSLIVYGSDAGWSYSDMRGFQPFMGPWLWYKVYWAGWAALLAVAAILLWPRGRAAGIGFRLTLARRRFTPRTAMLAAGAGALVLASGCFLFYSTNVLNAYISPSDAEARRAEYERRYGRHKGISQPQLTAVKLHAEIYPSRRVVEIDGTYHLVNATGAGIDFIHLATRAAVETTSVRFDRAVKQTHSDQRFGHRVYRLQTPLQPGESLELEFKARFDPRGFPNRGIDASVVATGAWFTNNEWLPALGYQEDMELANPAVRRAHGLAERPAVPLLSDAETRPNAWRAARTAVETVVGTEQGQIAVAPGRLRRKWTQNTRSYFHYATDVPIRNDFALFSAGYAVRNGQWRDPISGRDVSIEVLYHPSHSRNTDRMIRSVQASLDYYTKQFGPYPHGQVRLIERPGDGVVLHSAPVNITYDEGFSLMKPEQDLRGIDFPFAVVAHEVAHQWWGNTVIPADAEGAALLTETLAWYSAFGVVEQTFGRDHLQRLLGMMREAYVTPRSRANVPLLRATDQFQAYRKGPFAMYALREHAGAEQVNTALRRLLEKYGARDAPLATSLDLYGELQAVTPGSLRGLLADLFEANTFWEFETKGATADPLESGAWQVTLDVLARKVAVDAAGVETEIAMDDPVEIGVFAGSQNGRLDAPSYSRVHRVRSGRQKITLSCPSRPERAGIDPRHLLIDIDTGNNFREITIPNARPSRGR